jgi:hypothetical protein
MLKYRRRREDDIEAVRWANDINAMPQDIRNTITAHILGGEKSGGVMMSCLPPNPVALVCDIGDFIVRDSAGRIYPVDKVAFELLYEEIEDLPDEDD